MTSRIDNPHTRLADLKARRERLYEALHFAMWPVMQGKILARLAEIETEITVELARLDAERSEE